MAEQDSLSSFDFNSVSKPGKFLKFEAGKPVTIRILTKDPVVQEAEFTDKKTNEVNLRTTFCFIVYNFTANKAQILSAGPGMARTLQKIGTDEDFGANLNRCDVKISPEGEGLNRVYDINVVRHSGNETTLTPEMVREAQEINLDTDVKDSRGRLSQYEPGGVTPGKANISPNDLPHSERSDDIVIEDIDDQPINLDDIPF